MNGLALLLLLRLSGGAHAAGFIASPSSDSRHHRRVISGISSSRLNYNHNDDGVAGDVPPFSASESPRDRARRMEMVRELQRAFYKKHPSSSSGSSSLPSSSSPIRQKQPSGGDRAPFIVGSTVLRDLPTLTTDDVGGIRGAGFDSSVLPGHQFVWTVVGNPRHSHMFHTILAGPAPWYFAHVRNPGSSSNSGSGSPPEEAAGDASSRSNDGEDVAVLDDYVRSFREMKTELRKSSPPLHGTLLRITDRRLCDEDGRIVLAVQAVDRICVRSVTMANSAYLRVDAGLAPDSEFVSANFDDAMMSSASYLSSPENVQDDDDDDDDDAPLSSFPSSFAVEGAARAAASADTDRVRRFEFLPIFLEEKPKCPSSALASRSKANNDSNATRRIKDAIQKQERDEEEVKKAGGGGTEYSDVVQLANYDAFAYSSLGDAKSMTRRALENYWGHLAKEEARSRGEQQFAEEDLFVGTYADRSPSPFSLPDDEPSSHSRPQSSASLAASSPEAAEMMEYHVWLTIDEMMRLLSAATSRPVPLPSQLLGLLPKRDDWPREFVLEDYARSVTTAATGGSGSWSGIGGGGGMVTTTALGSHFVRVDDRILSPSKSSGGDDPPPAYSPLRRAQRLSYAIWILLDGLAMTGAEPRPPPRHEILCMGSIEERLDAAKRSLAGINVVIKKMIPENRKDGGDEK